MPKPTVVLTGACGTIAGVLLPALRERYDLRLLDTRDTAADGSPVPGAQIVDLMHRDRNRYSHHFSGADAVVHCAYHRIHDQGDDTYFSSELANLQLTYNVYPVAWEESLRRVVAASTNHAADPTKTTRWTALRPWSRPTKTPPTIGTAGRKSPLSRSGRSSPVA